MMTLKPLFIYRIYLSDYKLFKLCGCARTVSPICSKYHSDIMQSMINEAVVNLLEQNNFFLLLFLHIMKHLCLWMLGFSPFLFHILVISLKWLTGHYKHSWWSNKTEQINGLYFSWIHFLLWLHFLFMSLKWVYHPLKWLWLNIVLRFCHFAITVQHSAQKIKK